MLLQLLTHLALNVHLQGTESCKSSGSGIEKVAHTQQEVLLGGCRADIGQLACALTERASLSEAALEVLTLAWTPCAFAAGQN
jgi:hypothetical protein